jgi:uncharacterized protein (DUF983 family)
MRFIFGALEMAKDEGESKRDTLREGSRLACPHCGETMEVIGGKLTKATDRAEYAAATQGKRT